MPHSTYPDRQKNAHHHRRYSWPPSLHLVDVSRIDVPLPDIDEDPFAHFVSTSPPEEDIEAALDALACRAGIDTPSPLSRGREQAYRFRASITLKFARSIRRYLKNQVGHRTIKATVPVPCITTMSPSLEDELNAAQESQKPHSGDVEASLAESEASRKRPRPRHVSHHRHRHSWHAPSDEIYTIMEEE